MFVIQDSYYHTLGSLIDSLDLLATLISVQELQLVSGVCSMLEAMSTLTLGMGCDAVGTWQGVPARPFGASGTLHTSFGAIVETSAGLPVDGT